MPIETEKVPIEAGKVPIEAGKMPIETEKMPIETEKCRLTGCSRHPSDISILSGYYQIAEWIINKEKCCLH